ncbi:MAG: clostripain-related cysteine peptidase, partial [Candidatus Cloacimonetes bacterium]|nr:clostripain-related cysteine peptidase [Candidatus Cloacimonadota bacterium]
MAADNGLHSYAISDLIEMQKGLYSSVNQPNIIVFIDHISSYKNGNVEYLQIKPSNSDIVAAKVLKTYPDMDSGSGETLLYFLNWAYPKYKSEKNLLLLWSHGDGWIDFPNSIFGIGHDASSGSMIGVSTGELRSVFTRHKKKYDIIILDACYAGSLEILSEIQEFGDFILATPEEFPSIGYPWTEILMSWEPTQTSIETTELFASKFRQAYSVGGVYNEFGITDKRVSVCVYSLSKYQNLFEQIKVFSNQYADPKYSQYFTAIRNMTGVLEYNAPYGWIDLDLLFFVNKITELDVQDLVSATEDFVINRVTLGAAIEQSISIFYPRYLEAFVASYENYWHSLQLQNSGWARFLNYVYG